MQCTHTDNRRWRCSRPAKVGWNQRGLPYQWCERCIASCTPARRAGDARRRDRLEELIGTRRHMPKWEIKLIEDAQRVAQISNTTDSTTIGVQCTEGQSNE